MQIVVIRPDADPPAEASVTALAERTVLSAARLLVVENGKPKAKDLLAAVAEHLRADGAVGSVVVLSKPSAAKPMDQDTLVAAAEQADVALVGVGDCGACSAGSLRDALLLERHGIPSALVISEPFQGSVASFAARLGVPGYLAAVVPHPVASRSPEELAAFARTAADTVRRALNPAPVSTRS